MGRVAAVLRDRNALLFMSGEFISELGSRLTLLALSAKVYAMTQSALPMTLTFTVSAISMLVLAPVAGTVADRFDKKRTFILINLVAAAVSAGLILGNTMPAIYLLAGLQGAAQSFIRPVRSALLPSIVPLSVLLEVNSLRGTLRSLDMVIGYAIAALIVASFGYAVAFLLDAATFIVIAGLIGLVSISRTGGPQNWDAPRGALADLAAGARLLVVDRTVMLVSVVSVVTTLIVTMQVPLMYCFIAEYLGGPDIVPQRAGLLFSVSGIGGILGGVLLALIGRRLQPVLLLGVVLLLDALLFTMFTFSPYLPVSVVLFSTLGIMLTVVVAVSDSVIQTRVPVGDLGKVFGFLHALNGPARVGSLMIGGLAETAFGVRNVFLGCAAVEAFLALLVIRASRRKE